MHIHDLASQRGKYGFILADPAWTFATRSNKGKGRSPEQHYSCMTLDEIKALPVAACAAPDCGLGLWTIDTHIPQALEVITAWGFAFKTVLFNWAKLNRNVKMTAPWSEKSFFTGMGYWSRANPEICLFATRGAPKRIHKDVRRLIVAPRREHSRKPDEVHPRIERLLAGPYLEMFARTERPGWDSWGHEVDKFNRAPVHAHSG